MFLSSAMRFRYGRPFSTRAATATVTVPAVAPVVVPRRPVRQRLRQHLRTHWIAYRNWAATGALVVGTAVVIDETMAYVASLPADASNRLETTFIGGAVCALSLVAAYHLRHYLTPINVAAVYRHALRRTLHDTAVRAAFNGVRVSTGTTGGGGQRTVSGSIRTVTTYRSAPRYRREAGVTYSGWERYWRARTAQLVFTVEGRDESGARRVGIVMAQAERNINEMMRTTWLTVDAVDNGQRIVVASNGGGWRMS